MPACPDILYYQTRFFPIEGRSDEELDGRQPPKSVMIPFFPGDIVCFKKGVSPEMMVIDETDGIAVDTSHLPEGPIGGRRKMTRPTLGKRRTRDGFCLLILSRGGGEHSEHADR